MPKPQSPEASAAYPLAFIVKKTDTKYGSKRKNI